MVKDKEQATANALALLKDESVQRALAEIFSCYISDLHDILTIATIENAGVRPERLANEIFSSFHHIARGLCIPDADSDKEFRAARSTHLKRAILDSYKIAINAVLEEDNKAKELLDYMVLVEDFTRFIPDGLNKVNEIKNKSRSVKALYQSARKHEAHGNVEGAIDNFNKALEGCYELRSLLEAFTKDKSYILACAREAKLQQEKQRDRKFTLSMVLLTAVLSSLATYLVPKIFDSLSPTEVFASHAANVSGVMEDADRLLKKEE